MMDASNCDSASISSGLSTAIILSSAGAKFKEPPHTMQAFVFKTISFIFLIGNVTSARTSIVSAVPAGLVIERELVFGIVYPAAAIIGTTIGVVRLPGIPPMQCLSMIGYLLILSVSPCSTIALVSNIVSLLLMTCM